MKTSADPWGYYTPEAIARHKQNYRRPGFLAFLLECEQVKVKHHNHRAHKLGLASTLTVEAWVETLKDFEGMCAYCLTARYSVIEHFTPLSAGGGTTAANCIPACQPCNIRKSQHIGLPPEAMQRVATYLRERGGEV